MDPVDRIVEALQGRPELAMKLKARMAQLIVCGPWLAQNPWGDEPSLFTRRDLTRFFDIIAYVEREDRDDATRGWKYLIILGPKRNNWVHGLPSAEGAKAAADKILVESHHAVLTPDGVAVAYTG